MLNLFLAFNSETVLKSFEILWKGLLAIVVVVCIVMAITYLMQYISKRVSQEKDKKSPSNDTDDSNGQN